jgi:hypothetical protein
MKCRIWFQDPKVCMLLVLNGTMTRNKARLVAQGYTQVEGLDFDEIFTHVSRLESIRLQLGVFCILKFKLFQMDVKSTFEMVT